MILLRCTAIGPASRSVCVKRDPLVGALASNATQPKVHMLYTLVVAFLGNAPTTLRKVAFLGNAPTTLRKVAFHGNAPTTLRKVAFHGNAPTTLRKVAFGANAPTTCSYYLTTNFLTFSFTFTTYTPLVGTAVV